MAVVVIGARRHWLKAVPAFLLGTTVLLAACSGPAQVSRNDYQCSPPQVRHLGSLATRTAPQDHLRLDEVAGCMGSGLHPGALPIEKSAAAPVVRGGLDAGDSGGAPGQEEASDLGSDVAELAPNGDLPEDIATSGDAPQSDIQGDDKTGGQDGGSEGNDENAVEDDSSGAEQGGTEGTGEPVGNQGGNSNGQNPGGGGPQGNNGHGNGDEGDCSGNGCRDSTNPGLGGGGNNGGGKKLGRATLQ